MGLAAVLHAQLGQEKATADEQTLPLAAASLGRLRPRSSQYLNFSSVTHKNN